MKKHSKSLVALSISFLLFACHQTKQISSAFSSQDTSIINGEVVSQDDETYAMTARILLLMGDVWYPVCSASILSDDLILTAAHCVAGFDKAMIRVAFGAQPLTYESQKDPTTRVDVVATFQTLALDGLVTHPEYLMTAYDNDMAVLKVNGKLPTAFKATQLLNDEMMKEIEEGINYSVLLVGYGLVSEDPVKESDVLRKTTVPAQFEGNHLVTDQTQGSGGCNGDSGGPAYLTLENKLYLVGVTHGPTLDSSDCHHKGVWGNPNLEKEFLNKAAEHLGSSTRF